MNDSGLVRIRIPGRENHFSGLRAHVEIEAFACRAGKAEDIGCREIADNGTSKRALGGDDAATGE